MRATLSAFILSAFAGLLNVAVLSSVLSAGGLLLLPLQAAMPVINKAAAKNLSVFMILNVG
jgi:hypothetical protein